jgi:hypothetical protein
MATGWIPAVRQSRQLSLYWTPAAVGAGWGSLRQSLLKEFAGLSQQHGLGVRLVQANHPPGLPGGANVSITAIAGTASASLCGQTFTVTVNGKALAGETVAPEGSDGILAAAIFLPTEPHVMTPKALRRVGPLVMLHIALHEILHACGLETHTETGLFQANPHVAAGDGPASDKVRGGEVPGAPLMPPFFLDPASVREFKRNW